jgi:hypothetical protein
MISRYGWIVLNNAGFAQAVDESGKPFTPRRISSFMLWDNKVRAEKFAKQESNTTKQFRVVRCHLTFTREDDA